MPDVCEKAFEALVLVLENVIGQTDISRLAKLDYLSERLFGVYLRFHSRALSLDAVEVQAFE